MKTSFKNILIVLGFLLTNYAIANSVILPKNTEILVRLAQNINGNINNQGDTIYYQVLEDVLVNNQIVIKKGAFVKGKITNAETRKSLGKAGKLTIDARSVEAVDGQRVDIIRDAMTSEGRKRTGATVAHVIMWGPVGLFAKGRAARIMLDTEYDIEVQSDATINVNQQVVPQPNVETGLAVSFKKYKGKINYAKGKVGKPFILLLPLTESSNVSANDIQITEIQGHNLPKAIQPTSLNWDKKSNAYAASIPFVEMVKYISPGESSVKVQVTKEGVVHEGETSITTKWKLK